MIEPAPSEPVPDERHPSGNGSESAGSPATEKDTSLSGKPILEWTKEDWQVWAASLSSETRREPSQPAARVEPSEDGTDEAEAAPEVVGPPVLEREEQEEPAPPPPVALQPARAQAEPARAAPPFDLAGMAAGRRLPKRLRSALGLVALSVAVGASVAGLVTFILVLSGVLLRRAFG